MSAETAGPGPGRTSVAPQDGVWDRDREPVLWRIDDLGQREEHRAHAREHLAAAEALETAELRECAEIPSSERGACPLLTGAVGVAEIEDGVRVYFDDPDLARVVSARARCQQAFAAARGWDGVASCALSMPGARISLGDQGRYVDATSFDRDVVERLRRRVREAFGAN